MLCPRSNGVNWLTQDVKYVPVVARQSPRWNISKKASITRESSAVLYVSNGLRACLGLAICELTAIVALLVERNGKARRMK